MHNNKWPAALVWALAGTLLISGCGGSDDSPAANSGQEPATAPENSAVAPDTDTFTKTATIDRYNVANGCYTLEAGGHYLLADPQSGRYSITPDSDQATSFRLRPTRLGAYLLMSDYQRTAGEVGSFELLGISDPAGEFLDETGTFIGEISYLVAGLGDTTNLILDPVAPLGDALRAIGESLEFTGDQIGETTVNPALAMVDAPSDLAVWQLQRPGPEPVFTLASDVTGLMLTTTEDGLALASPSVIDEAGLFTLREAKGCKDYPEAELNADILDEKGPATYLKEVDRFRNVQGIDKDDVFGFVDTHSHISAYEFIGGRVNYGAPFHRFGVTHALHDCEAVHGPWGATGFVELATSGIGTHDTQGWPTFNDWPRYNSLQHHQSYYRWLERAHLAGMKILVNHLVHNEILCRINPQKENDCDPMESILLQIQRMYEMQDYIDAQHGGPGEGWFRIVTSPGQAREVIGDGKLAVVLGIEMSKVFKCGEFLGVAECTREEIVERLDQFYQLGVRNIFPVHKFDNAFGGHLPDLSTGIGIGPILYAGNLLETGHPVEFEQCPENVEYTGGEPDQNATLQPFGLIDQLLYQMDYLGERFPETPEEMAALDPRRGTDQLCNRRGLSDLGDFLIKELVRRKMMIETDHISRKAAARILEITRPLDYPVINSHGGWGGTEALRDRIASQGGITASFGGTREDWVHKLTRDGNRPRKDGHKVGPFGGAGFASDVNGIAQLAANPGTAADEAGLYPFTSVDGRVRFDIQRTGDREFSLYDGRGVAHYGLYPDQIEDMIRNSDADPEQIDDAINQLFTSAEAYLRMWERIESAPL
ncbi:membrane dipeptidase [Marinobacter pelagius]|uniref:Membrane dipeptidase (Peptidase family M19) n=1 Tax=Marinobacter pelagius TaxID=379482 RepID=A0A1I4R3I6_9GAMM|nr:membrane dipeptidase [Marinobacter pelagius]SFM46500.1 Membrane dipeptidase (Peptidase family M19) [Marinobacter pelagius]